MDRDETCGTGSCRATSSDQYGGVALQRQEPTWIQQTQVAFTYPPPDVQEGLWSRWHVIGEVVYAGSLATGKDHVPALEFWSCQHRRGPGSRLIFHPPTLGRRWGTLSPMVGLVLAGSLGEAGQDRDSPPHPHHLFPTPLRGWLGQRPGDGRAW